MENEPFSKVTTTPRAPYIEKTLIPNSLEFKNYWAVHAGSVHDYLAMTSGYTSVQEPVQSNVFQALTATGTSWAELEESEAGNCVNQSSGDVPGTSVPLYAIKHDPAQLLEASGDDCTTYDQPLTSIPNPLPAFSYIVPNQCDDMHSTSQTGSCPAFFGPTTATGRISQGDVWLAQVVPQLVSEGATVILTWDEGNSTSEQVLTLVTGAGVTPGTDAALYDHYSLEAGLYAYLGLGTPQGAGASATPLPIP